MAIAPIPKPGFSSPAAMEGGKGIAQALLSPSRPGRVAVEIGNNSMPRTEPFLALAHSMSAREVTLFMFLFCFVTSILGGTAFAAEFAVSGTFNIKPLRVATGRPKVVSGYFSVTSKDCKWLIRSKRFDQVNDYDQDAYDGRYVYTLSGFESWVRSRQKQGEPVGVNVGEGIVTVGSFPQNSTQINKVLWLAFASSCYFETNSTGQLPPIAAHSAHRAYLYGFQQEAYWHLDASMTKLPDSVVIFDDGRTRRWKDSDGFMIGPPDEIPWSPPYDKGFTNAILSAGEFITYGPNLKLPHTVTFNVYGPKREGISNADLDLFKSYTFEVTNVLLSLPSIDIRPPLSGPIQVTDERFQLDKTPIFQVSYLSTNNWLTDETVRLLPEFSKAIPYQNTLIAASKSAAAAGTPVANSASKRFAIYSLLLIASAVGLILVVRDFRQKTANQNLRK